MELKDVISENIEVTFKDKNELLEFLSMAEQTTDAKWMSGIKPTQFDNVYVPAWVVLIENGIMSQALGKWSPDYPTYPASQFLTPKT